MQNQSEQLRNSRKEFHQAPYEPFFQLCILQPMATALKGEGASQFQTRVGRLCGFGTGLSPLSSLALSWSQNSPTSSPITSSQDGFVVAR